MKLIFATNNENKVREIRSLIKDDFDIITLKEAGIDTDIPEPFQTLEENASAKSQAIFEMTGINCFSEDTGLEVDALGGEPGVKSARYAGDSRSPDANNEKLLSNLAGIQNRNAHFKTVISLIIEGKEYLFTGICEGRIAEEKTGYKGFGYDPIFIPQGAERSFAEMEMDEKNRFSHRAKATRKLVVFLNNLLTNR